MKNLPYQCNNKELAVEKNNRLPPDTTKLDRIVIIDEQPSYSQAFKLVLTRDLVIALRHKDDFLNPLLFFIIIHLTYNYIS